MKMWISYSVFFFFFLVVGIIGSVYDLRTGKIPNRLFAVGSAFAVAVHVIDFIVDSNEYLSEWISIIGISSLLSIAMFFGELWAAGDTKFFILLLLCIPTQMIVSDSISVSVVPYIYIFSLAIIWILLDTLWKTLNNAERFSNEKSFSLKSLTDLIKIYIESQGQKDRKRK